MTNSNTNFNEVTPEKMVGFGSVENDPDAESPETAGSEELAVGMEADEGGGAGGNAYHSGRIGEITRMLEFGPDILSRLEGVYSSRELLSFTYDVLLARFLRMGKIANISRDSQAAANSLVTKFEAVVLEDLESLCLPEAGDGDPGCSPNGPYSLENTIRGEDYFGGLVEMARTVTYAEFMKVEQRNFELLMHLKVLKNQYNRLLPVKGERDDLKLQIQHLKTKIQEQARMLNSLANRSVEADQQIARLNQLKKENQSLRKKLENYTSVINELCSRLPENHPARKKLTALLRSNEELFQSLGNRASQLDTFAGPYPDGGLDELNRENQSLRELASEKGRILKEMQGAAPDWERMMTRLKEENEHLHQIIAQKDEQIESLAKKADNGILMYELSGEKEENRKLNQTIKDLRKTVAEKNQLCSLLRAEKQEIEIQLRSRKDLMDENKAIKSENDFLKRLCENLEKTEKKHNELKDAYSRQRSEHDSLQIEHEKLKKKMVKMAAINRDLINQYQSLFGESGG